MEGGYESRSKVIQVITALRVYMHKLKCSYGKVSQTLNESI